MVRNHGGLIVAAAMVVLAVVGGTAQAEMHSIHEQHAPPADISSNVWLNVIEILTGLAASLMALQATLAYRAGRLGRGMRWVTLGMVVMAIGHIILVVRRIADFDLLGFLGHSGSFVGFSVAVFLSFVSSALGFWLIRHQAAYYEAVAATATQQRSSRSMPPQT
jgi:hypothetical protein